MCARKKHTLCVNAFECYDDIGFVSPSMRNREKTCEVLNEVIKTLI